MTDYAKYYVADLAGAEALFAQLKPGDFFLIRYGIGTQRCLMHSRKRSHILAYYWRYGATEPTTRYDRRLGVDQTHLKKIRPAQLLLSNVAAKKRWPGQYARTLTPQD